MEISEAGLALIREFEGLRLISYVDVNGNGTIGYGHKIRPGEKFPQGINKAEAEMMMKADAEQAAAEMLALVKVDLTQGQFDALTDFVYNEGSGRLEHSTLLRDLNAGRYDDARNELLVWDIAGGRVQPGLQARRHAEFNLWIS